MYVGEWWEYLGDGFSSSLNGVGITHSMTGDLSSILLILLPLRLTRIWSRSSTKRLWNHLPWSMMSVFREGDSLNCHPLTIAYAACMYYWSRAAHDTVILTTMWRVDMDKDEETIEKALIFTQSILIRLLMRNNIMQKAMVLFPCWLITKLPCRILLMIRNLLMSIFAISRASKNNLLPYKRDRRGFTSYLDKRAYPN